MADLVRQHLLDLTDRRILDAAGIRGFKAAVDGDFDALRKRIRQHEDR